MRPAILTSLAHPFDCHNSHRAAAIPPAAQTSRRTKDEDFRMTLLQVELDLLFAFQLVEVNETARAALAA